MARTRKPDTPKAKTSGRKASGGDGALPLWSIGAAALAGGLALIGIFARRREGVFAPGNAEHAAPDLALDAPKPGTNRAPDAFRPDPTAPVPESEREGLRPATGPAPTLVKGQADELRRLDAAPS